MRSAIRFVVSCLISVTSFGAITLDQAYKSTLEHNPSAKIAESRSIAASEATNQTWGAILPRISAVGNYTRQDTPEDKSSGVISRSLAAEQSTARLNIVQPLFRGFGEWAAERSAKASQRSIEFQEADTRLNLYSRTAEVFYGLLLAAKDLENLRSIEKLSADRLAEIRNRVKVGRNRKGDLLSAEAQLASVSAQVEQSENAYKDALDAWTLTTGLSADSLPGDEASAPQEAGKIDTFLEALDRRPDIESAKASVEAADEKITVARAGHFPSLDATGNYYLKRDGTLSEVKWDIGLQLTIPLFAGGAVSAGVSESAELHKQAVLSLENARREARRQIVGLHHSYSSSLKQLQAFERAQKLAEINYQEQSRDYRFGLVNNLEVLQALSSLQDSRRNRDKTFYQSKSLYAQLLASIGKIP